MREMEREKERYRERGYPFLRERGIERKGGRKGESEGGRDRDLREREGELEGGG